MTDRAATEDTLAQPSRAATRGGVMARVQSLDTLVGAHPDALRDIYRAGAPADPTKLGAAPRGLLLALEPLRGAHMLARPAVKLLATRLLPWKGKSFTADGGAGVNRVFGARLWRFRCELADSTLDGRPTLVLRYDDVGNLWPVSHIVDELRRIEDEIAIGPASLRSDGGDTVIAWWGLTTLA